MSRFSVFSAILLIGTIASIDGLKCNEGFNVTLGGIPLYHWMERNCTDASKCFGQQLGTKLAILGNVDLRYGACIARSYADLLDCSNMFSPDSGLNPADLINLVPDIENRFNDVVMDFVNGSIVKLFSNGQNIDEFVSGTMKFMETIGFNMNAFKPLQPAIGNVILALFNTSDLPKLNATMTEFFTALGHLDTNNVQFANSVYKFFGNFYNLGGEIYQTKANHTAEIKANHMLRPLVENVPGLIKSMFPTTWNTSLWYDVTFKILGDVNFTQPKQTMIDAISTIKSTYDIPTNVSKILDPLFNSLPDLVEQLGGRNFTYAGLWYLELFKMYSERNNATKSFDDALLKFIKSVSSNTSVQNEIKTTIQWLPGMFYKFFPAEKSIVEDAFYKMADGFNSFNFSNLNDTAASTKLSEFVLDFYWKKLGSGKTVSSTERAFVVNFSSMFYNLLSNYTVELDQYVQIFIDGFQNYPDFNAGVMITNLVTTMGGIVPQEVKPLLEHLQTVLNETYLGGFNFTNMLNSFTTVVDAYKVAFPDSEFPILSQQLINIMLNLTDAIVKGTTTTEESVLNQAYWVIDFEFAIFKVINISRNTMTEAALSVFPENELYFVLMSVLDPSDVKQFAKDCVKWLVQYQNTPGAYNATTFFDSTRRTIYKITSKFTRNVTNELRNIFGPDSCKFGSCNEDLCNSHSYIDSQSEFTKPTTTTRTTTPSSPKDILRCVEDTIHSPKVKDRSYTFPKSEGNSLTRSTESCANYSYSATIQCVVITPTSATPKGYFDIGTLKEYPCDMNTVTSLLNTVKKTNITSSTLESTMGEISAVSSIPSTQNVKKIIKLLDVLHKSTKENDINVTEDTLVSLLWVTEDIHDTVQSEANNGKAILTREEQISFLTSLEVFASNLVITDDVFTLKSSSNLFQAQRLYCSGSESSVITFNGTITEKDDMFQTHVQSSIPSSAFITNCSERKNAAFYLHKDSTLFPSPANAKSKINQVLSLQISKTTLRNLTEPIKQTFGQPQRKPETKRDFVSHRCAYLDLSIGEWKYDGCRTIVVDSGTTSCLCDHTTNFAVLVQTHEVESSYVINIVGYIGCSCSAVGLLLVLIIYLAFEKLRVNQINQIHIHLSICLLVAYLTFLFGVERPRAYVPCMTIGAVLQFSFLSAWGWMFAECVTMFKKFVKVFSPMSSTYVMKTSFMVYIFAFVYTCTTGIVAYLIGDSVEYKDWALAADNDPLFHPSHYVSDRLCWLHGYSLYFGFLTPVAVIFVANIFGFVRIIRVLTKPNAELLRSNKVKKNELRDHAFRILTVSVLLGVTWAFAIPLTITDDYATNEIFGWMFSIGNAFQGVLIFFLFCVKREDVRNMWTECLFGRRSQESGNAYSLSTVSVSASASGTAPKTSTSTMER